MADLMRESNIEMKLGASGEDGEEKKGRQVNAEDVDKASDRWDYVIMFGGMKTPQDKQGNQLPEDSSTMTKYKELMAERRKLVALLKEPKHGLTVARKKSGDGNAVFVLITAHEDRLISEADEMDMLMKLKAEHGGGYAPFELDQKEYYEGTDEGLFRRTQKLLLLEHILQADPERGGVGLNLDQLVKRGIISKIYPLHQEDKRKALISNWAAPRNMIRHQPLDDIRNYFGEEIALYFAWLGFYTKWLVSATLLGIVAFVFYLIDKGTNAGWTIWPIVIYSIFLAVWATLFLEYWKRFNNELNFNWGMEDFKTIEVERPDFYGEEMQGVYSGGTWVPLDPSVDYGFKLPAPRKYYPSLIRNGKIVASVPLMVAMCTVVVIVTISVLSFRLFVQNQHLSVFGSFVGGIINAITIIFLNVVWKTVATKLTEWENHRTQSDFENNLIAKIFVFYFVNSYTSLYYIAFFKKGTRFWGVSELKDDCKFGNLYATVSWGCADELTVQLATILGVNMFIGQAREVAIPWLVGKIQLSLLKRNMKKAGEETDNLPQWEKESKKPKFPGTFDEYSEMIIQFGYITLFASAFPVAPLMALLNNIVEIRTDAFKLLTAYTRPEYSGAQSIGTWFAILELLGVLAVVTNCLLIGFSFAPINKLLSEDYFHVFAVIVAMEHIILFTKYIIAVLIPDVPGWIKKEQSRQDFIKEGLVKKLKGVKKQTWSDGGVVEEDKDAKDDAGGEKKEEKVLQIN